MIDTELSPNQGKEIDSKFDTLEKTIDIYSKAAIFYEKIKNGQIKVEEYQTLDDFHKNSIKYINSVQDFRKIIDKNFETSLVDKLDYIYGFLSVNFKSKKES